MPRHSSQTRCTGCGLIPGRCICAALPRVRLPWRLLLLQHRREARKPTNTARLLARVVLECSIVAVATRERAWSPALLGPDGEQRVVLFPSPDAPPADRALVASWSERPTCVILVDGTWRQAGRIVRRAAGVAELPRVSLPSGAPSRWSIRRAPRPEQLCTFEALVRLAALLPDPSIAHALERAFSSILAAQQVDAVPRAPRTGTLHLADPPRLD